MSLALGSIAPDFELVSSHGRKVRLSRELAETPLVLFFYPKNFSRVCTQEVCGFRDVYERLEEMGIALLGISKDAVSSHQSFRDRYSLPFELLADVTGSVTRTYGAALPFIGLPDRITYLINPEHKIELVVKSLFSADAHTDQIMSYIDKKGLALKWAASANR